MISYPNSANAQVIPPTSAAIMSHPAMETSFFNYPTGNPNEGSRCNEQGVEQLGLGPGACHHGERDGSEAKGESCGLDDADCAVHVVPPGRLGWLVFLLYYIWVPVTRQRIWPPPFSYCQNSLARIIALADKSLFKVSSGKST